MRQRTGWGKSAVYFLATALLRERGAGPALIDSPLLALMRNQIAAAERLGISALTINSTNRDAADLGRRLLEVPVNFKWFVEGLVDGSVGFGGEESAGRVVSASRRDCLDDRQGRDHRLWRRS